MEKTVLITGASRGIGFALAEHFLNNGYTVIGTSRNEDINNLTHENFVALELDLTKKESVHNINEILSFTFPYIDILINNAGIGPDLYTLEPEIKNFEQTFDVNVTGTVFFTEIMQKNIKNGGKIINISSKMGSVESCILTDSVAYRMSKAALNMYTKILANRLADKQFVAAVHPGWVRTTIANGNINGRLSPAESALKIFEFAVSDFETGIFWNIETHSEIAW